MEMTSNERFLRMYQHKEADRIPIIDHPWGGTLRRWREEGLPTDTSWESFFGIDAPAHIEVDNSPRFPREIIEDTPTYRIVKSSWGVTMKQWKYEDSTPEFLDFKVGDSTAWPEAKERMKYAEDRINWKALKENYEKWRAEGRWIIADFWFGFDVTHSWMVGTENMLIALCEEPEWCMDMFDTYLRLDLACFEKIWDAGYHFDCISWPDDMGYKGTMFFSNDMYREILKPYHQRAIDWAHERGAYAHMHSCGNIMDRVDDLVGMGLDALNPLEVKAGMKPLALKEKYGDKLVLHGGINAVLWNDKDAIIEEIRNTVPRLKENGGYIFSSDHSIPNSVSLENFRAIVEEVKRVGAYQ
ncbi:MAG: hypothetical protein KBS76_04020 [Ruminococcus sp.]|nr:hypothetical protein [Candidatus Apopatosoma intestinale]